MDQLDKLQKRMSAPTVNFEYPPEKVSWTKRDVLLFANSIGCNVSKQLHYLYEGHPDFQIFPTYPIVLTFKYDSSDVVDFLRRNTNAPIPECYPKLDWTRAVDGRRRIRIFKQIPASSAGRSWEVRSRIIGIHDKGTGKGTVMERVHDLVDTQTGELYTRSWESCFFLGTGGWGGHRGPRLVEYPIPTDRKADVVHTVHTATEIAHLYRLNGDYNPLHASPEAGEKLGYGGIIIHGLFGWNVAARVILDQFALSHERVLRDFEARFAAPVRPGDSLTILLWNMGIVEESTDRGEPCHFNEIRFNVKVEDQTVLSNGRALLELPRVSGKL